MDNEQLTNRVPMSCARLDAVRALAPRTCEGGGTSVRYFRHPPRKRGGQGRALYPPAHYRTMPSGAGQER